MRILEFVLVVIATVCLEKVECQDNLFDLLSSPLLLSNASILSITDIATNMRSFAEQLHRLGTSSAVSDMTFEKIYTLCPGSHVRLQKLRQLITNMHSQELQGFEEFPNDFKPSKLLTIAEQIVSPHGYDVPNVPTSIHSMIMDDPKLFDRLVRDVHEHALHICDAAQSAQQLLLELWQTVLTNQLRAYALQQFSWMIVRSGTNDSSYIEESHLMRDDLADRLGMQRAQVYNAVNRTNRDVWRCDPARHQLGVTYDRLTRLLQGYVENESDLHADGYCRQDCGYFSSATSQGCYDERFCGLQKRCRGQIHDCFFVDGSMRIGVSNDPTRRYETVHNDYGLMYGSGHPYQKWQQAKSWRRWLFWRCDYCMCICDEEGPGSDRYFSLRPVISNTDSNRIITGLRFRKINRIFHLQAQDGVLQPFGMVDATTVRWIPVNAFHHYQVYKNIDYHAMSYEQRQLVTGDLNTKSGEVLTGVRFVVRDGRLALQIRASKVDVTAGRVSSEHRWIPHGHLNGGQIPLIRPNVPSLSPHQSMPSSGSFIRFDPSDWRADVAQSTVPYLDIQDVVVDPPMALAGVGIYHKGSEGFGGFVAPKLITYNVIDDD